MNLGHKIILFVINELTKIYSYTYIHKKLITVKSQVGFLLNPPIKRFRI